jgi:hypothetical protein
MAVSGLRAMDPVHLLVLGLRGTCAVARRGADGPSGGVVAVWRRLRLRPYLHAGGALPKNSTITGLAAVFLDGHWRNGMDFGETAAAF